MAMFEWNYKKPLRSLFNIESTVSLILPHSLIREVLMLSSLSIITLHNCKPRSQLT